MATNIKLSQYDNGSRKPSVADTYHVDADPDPAFLFDADPDPDPPPHESETNLQPLAYRSSAALLYYESQAKL
jgi:hypothetical protein